MKITWLGQAGLLIEAAGKKIIVDPYLSDSVSKVNPKNYRRLPIDENFLRIIPDILVLTHNHLDHADPETLPHYLGKGGSVTVLASGNAWAEVRKYGGEHNFVCFDRHTEWSEGDIRFIAVHAEHSDDRAIGVVIEAEGKRLYITGDALYNSKIFDDVLPLGELDAIFLPINGVGNNMNMRDAKRFCERLSPRVAVPMHFGLFDSIRGEAFEYEPKAVPEIYKEIKI